MIPSQADDTLPVVSVIIPVYNVEKYLARCLDSLVSQSAKVPYEIICINDCSPDSCVDILEDYAYRFPNLIRIFENEENRGVGATRDRGVQEATGEYCMFIDSDDSVCPDYIEQYFRAMQASPCDIVIGGYIEVDGQHETTCFLPHSPWTELSFSAPWSKLYRSSFIREHNLKFTSIRYAEDTLFSLYAFAYGARCTYIDYAGYCYFSNPTSITRAKDFDKNLEKTLTALYQDFIESRACSMLSQEKRHMVEYSYIADMLSTILLFNRGCGPKRMREKYQFFQESLERLFPSYRKNPHLTFPGPQGQRPKIRQGVSLFMLADRLGLSRLLFSAFSIP